MRIWARLIIIGISFFLAFIHTFAQPTKVRGKVYHAETHEPLPFVSVAFKGTTVGTISGFEGEYFIETRHPSDSLVASYLGYETEVRFVRKQSYQVVNFYMKPVNLQIEEVVITPGENPAHPILRNIIANKKRNSEHSLETFYCDIYNKVEVDLNNVDDQFMKRKVFKQFQFVFDNLDTSAITGKTYLPVFLTETFSKYYYRSRPKTEREVIEATKISGIENESVAQFTGKMYQKFNIYKNFITVFEPGFVSPIADFGLLYYKYYLIDSAYRDDLWCYHISFKPKRKQERTFTGDFWVDSESWGIKNFTVRMAGDANINFINDLVVSNEYILEEDSVWFLKQEELFVDFNLTDNTVGFFGRKTTLYDNYVFNEPINTNVFNENIDIIVEEGAMDKDDQFWSNERPVKLSEKEEKIYSMVDSVKNVPLYRTVADLVNLAVNYYYVKGNFEFGPYYTLYSFNPIEGSRFRMGGRTSNQFSTKIMFDGYLAFGTKDLKVKYGVGFIYIFSKNPRIAFGMSYEDDIQQLGKSENAFNEDNILSSVLRRNPNDKLTYIKQFNAYYEKEWFQGVSNTISFDYKRVYPNVNVPFELITNNGLEPISSLSASEVTLNTRFAYREKFLMGEFTRVSLGTKYPILEFNLTYGMTGVLGSEYEYFKVDMEVSDKLHTSPFGYFKYKLEAGRIFGELPYPLLELHEGNETYAFDYFAFNMMNYYEFVSDKYVSLFVEQHFQGFFLNRVPLFRKLKLREVASGRALIGGLDDANRNVMQFPVGMSDVNKPYVEASIGVENILKIVRIDAMWRFSYLDHRDIQIFGLRAMLQIIL